MRATCTMFPVPVVDEPKIVCHAEGQFKGNPPQKRPSMPAPPARAPGPRLLPIISGVSLTRMGPSNGEADTSQVALGPFLGGAPSLRRLARPRQAGGRATIPCSPGWVTGDASGS